MLILLFLLVGAFVGWLLPRWPRLLRGNHHATNGAIYLLVFLLGVSIGGNEAIRAALPQLGGQAAWLSLGALLGSLLLSQLVYYFVLRERTAVTTPAVKTGFHLSAFLGSLIILLFFVSGMVASWWGWLPARAQDERLTLGHALPAALPGGRGAGWRQPAGTHLAARAAKDPADTAGRSPGVAAGGRAVFPLVA
jgi:hypothetical protein